MFIGVTSRAAIEEHLIGVADNCHELTVFGNGAIVNRRVEWKCGAFLEENGANVGREVELEAGYV